MFLALRAKEITHAWSFRVRYGTANRRSFRFVFCQISYPPLSSPPPSHVFFVLEPPKRDLGTRSSNNSLYVVGMLFPPKMARKTKYSIQSAHCYACRRGASPCLIVSSVTIQRRLLLYGSGIMMNLCTLYIMQGQC